MGKWIVPPLLLVSVSPFRLPLFPHTDVTVLTKLILSQVVPVCESVKTLPAARVVIEGDTHVWDETIQIYALQQFEEGGLTMRNSTNFMLLGYRCRCPCPQVRLSLITTELLSKLILLTVLFVLRSHAQQYGWQVIARPTTQGLLSVDFVDSLNGWTAAVSSSIYKTSDGGNSWTAYSGAPMQVKSISMVDTGYGWCAGDDGISGRIIRTTTGGRSWELQLEIQHRAYNGSAAQSKRRNTTAGDKDVGPDTGFVVRTSNAGADWQEQRFGPNTRLGRVVFIDSLHGWILSNTGLLRTINGGIGWQLVTSRYFGAISFIDTALGWGVAVKAFFRTTDGGVTWDSLYTIPGPPINDDDFEAFALSFVDTLNGWAFGEGVYQGSITETIYRTTNGGSYWYRESIGLTPDLDGINDGIMLDRYHGWAVCGGGWVLGFRPLTSVIEKLPGVPKNFVLHQNYPNPFNATTMIEYELAHRTEVKLTVHDLLGKSVETLVDQTQEAGIYRVRFNAAALASGTYFYTLATSEYQETKQVLFVR